MEPQMSHHPTLAQMADVIREQALVATAEKLGIPLPQVVTLVENREPAAFAAFVDFVRAGSDAAQRLNELGFLAIAA